MKMLVISAVLGLFLAGLIIWGLVKVAQTDMCPRYYQTTCLPQK